MITTTNLLARVRRGRPAQPRAEVAANTAQRGFTTLEAAVASVLLAVTFLAMAGTFSSGMGSAARAKAYDRGAVFLEETMSSIAGQPFDAAVAMNGNRIFNTPSPAERFPAHRHRGDAGGEQPGCHIRRALGHPPRPTRGQALDFEVSAMSQFQGRVHAERGATAVEVAVGTGLAAVLSLAMIGVVRTTDRGHQA